MSLGLHNFLRVIIPGIILLAEGFLLYAFSLLDFPSNADTWAVLSKDWGKTTGFALIAFALGGLYRYLEITH
jgi:hypothetical protein